MFIVTGVAAPSTIAALTAIFSPPVNVIRFAPLPLILAQLIVRREAVELLIVAVPPKTISPAPVTVAALLSWFSVKWTFW